MGIESLPGYEETYAGFFGCRQLLRVGSLPAFGSLG